VFPDVIDCSFPVFEACSLVDDPDDCCVFCNDEVVEVLPDCSLNSLDILDCVDC